MGGLVPIFGPLGGLLCNLTERFMDGIAALPAGFRRRREKVFGQGCESAWNKDPVLGVIGVQ